MLLEARAQAQRDKPNVERWKAEVAKENSGALYGAADKGNLNEVRGLLLVGANPDGGKYSKPLSVALRRGHNDIATLLLKRGANPTDTYPWSSLSSGRPSIDMVNALLDSGANPNEGNVLNVYRTIQKRNASEALKVFDAMREVGGNGFDEAWFGKLMVLAMNTRDRKLIDWLDGVGVTLKDPMRDFWAHETDGVSTLAWAAQGGELEFFNYVKEATGGTLMEGERAGQEIRYAMAGGNWNIYQYFLELGQDPMKWDDQYVKDFFNSETGGGLWELYMERSHVGELAGPVGLAVLGGNLDILKDILERGGDINEFSSLAWQGPAGSMNLYRPLAGALGAIWGPSTGGRRGKLYHREIAVYLLDQGATPFVDTVTGRGNPYRMVTEFLGAVRLKDRELVKRFLDLGADPLWVGEHIDESSHTPYRNAERLELNWAVDMMRPKVETPEYLKIVDNFRKIEAARVAYFKKHPKKWQGINFEDLSKEPEGAELAKMESVLGENYAKRFSYLGKSEPWGYDIYDKTGRFYSIPLSEL
ncbi:MAG: hypothetical protein ACPGN3_03680 [Opitutales bacterium]